MNFNKHSKLAGKHAFLSASKYAWIRYDADKIATLYSNHIAAAEGTKLHDLAAKCIEMKQPLPDRPLTLNMYVNDAIAFKMTPEVTLYYSENAFGTADSIFFDGLHLRIHDLKTGTTPASFDQLLVYTSFFCLEYDVDPASIDIVLRIYQNNECFEKIPTLSEIIPIIDKIVLFDSIIEQINNEEVFHG